MISTTTELNCLKNLNGLVCCQVFIFFLLSKRLVIKNKVIYQKTLKTSDSQCALARSFYLNLNLNLATSKLLENRLEHHDTGGKC